MKIRLITMLSDFSIFIQIFFVGLKIQKINFLSKFNCLMLCFCEPQKQVKLKTMDIFNLSNKK